MTLLGHGRPPTRDVKRDSEIPRLREAIRLRSEAAAR